MPEFVEEMPELEGAVGLLADGATLGAVDLLPPQPPLEEPKLPLLLEEEPPPKLLELFEPEEELKLPASERYSPAKRLSESKRVKRKVL